MLVFRNQTSYERFWTGRNYLTTMSTSCRNLSRAFLTCSYLSAGGSTKPNTPEEDAEVYQVVGVLIAILYAVKNHLRAEWGDSAPISLKDDVEADSNTPRTPTNLISRILLPSHSTVSTASTIVEPSGVADYAKLLPAELENCEDRGLGLALELSFFVERFIMRGADRGWFRAPQESQMQVQLNTLIDAYGKMETIRLTPIPIAHM